MTPDQFDNNTNNDKVREITQDRRNASSDTGSKQEPASLSFDFENRPEEPDVFNFEFENKPDVTPAEEAEEAAAEPVIEKAPAEEAEKAAKQSFAEEFLELLGKYYEQGIYIRVANDASAPVRWGDDITKERKIEQIISDLEIRPIF